MKGIALEEPISGIVIDPTCLLRSKPIKDIDPTLVINILRKNKTPPAKKKAGTDKEEPKKLKLVTTDAKNAKTEKYNYNSLQLI